MKDKSLRHNFLKLKNAKFSIILAHKSLLLGHVTLR